MPLNLTSITWQFSDVDEAGYSTWPSLAFSASGQAAIAYASSNMHALRFATLGADGVTWTTSSVDTVNNDASPSLVFRLGQANIGYRTGVTNEMRIAVNRGGAPPWTINTFAPGDGNSSLAVGPSHHVGISFHDKDKGVSYATPGQNFSVWTSMPADGKGNGYFNSLAFGPDGRPAVAYSSTNDQIKYAVFDGAHWHTQKVDDGDGWVTLAFTPAGEPAVGYMVRPTSSETAVKYAVLRGGAWQVQVIALKADSPSLAFTPAGEPALSYHDAAAAAVQYVVFTDGAWQHFLVEKSGKDQNGVYRGDFTLTSLAFSPSGQPAIAYFDRYNGSIRFAMGTPSGGGVRGAGWWSRLRDLVVTR